MLGLRTLIFDVASLDAAKSYYAKVLGKAPYFDQPFYVGFDVAGYELGLRPAEGACQPGPGGATGYLGAHDVAATVDRLVALGATIREPVSEVGEGIITAVVTDPFGNQLGLIHNPHFFPALVTAGEGDLSPRSIVHEVTVAGRRENVWKLWATREGLTSWLVSEARVELRPGGPYEIAFLADAPLGKRGSETCSVLSFIPERMLSVRWNAPPHLSTRNDHTWVVIELDDAVAGTEVKVTHLGWPASKLASDPAWEATFQYFDRAWRNVLDQLEAFTRTGKRP